MQDEWNINRSMYGIAYLRPLVYLEIKNDGTNITNYLQISVNSQGDCDDRVEVMPSDLLWETPIILRCERRVPPLLITNSTRLKVSLKLGLETISEGIKAKISFFGKQEYYHIFFISGISYWS